MKMRPSVGCTRPAIIRRVVVLPQPDGSDQDSEFAVGDLVVEGLDGGRIAVLLRDALKRDARHVCHPLDCVLGGVIP